MLGFSLDDVYVLVHIGQRIQFQVACKVYGD